MEIHDKCSRMEKLKLTLHNCRTTVAIFQGLREISQRSGGQFFRCHLCVKKPRLAIFIPRPIGESIAEIRNKEKRIKYDGNAVKDDFHFLESRTYFPRSLYLSEERYSFTDCSANICRKWYETWSASFHGSVPLNSLLDGHVDVTIKSIPPTPRPHRDI